MALSCDLFKFNLTPIQNSCFYTYEHIHKMFIIIGNKVKNKWAELSCRKVCEGFFDWKFIGMNELLSGRFNENWSSYFGIVWWNTALLIWATVFRAIKMFCGNFRFIYNHFEIHFWFQCTSILQWYRTKCFSVQQSVPTLAKTRSLCENDKWQLSKQISWLTRRKDGMKAIFAHDSTEKWQRKWWARNILSSER